MSAGQLSGSRSAALGRSGRGCRRGEVQQHRAVQCSGGLDGQAVQVREGDLSASVVQSSCAQPYGYRIRHEDEKNLSAILMRILLTRR